MVPISHPSYCICTPLHGHLLTIKRFITDLRLKVSLKMSSGIGRYFWGLVFVYCLYKVTRLSPHFYEDLGLSTSESQGENIPVVLV